MTVYELTIPAPTTWLNANHRTHWAPKSRDVRTWRQTVRDAALAAGIPPLEGRVRITGWMHPLTARSFDPANYYPTFKAAVDGLVEAGVLVDDDWTRVVGPDMRRGGKSRPSMMRLLIEPCGKDEE